MLSVFDIYKIPSETSIQFNWWYVNRTRHEATFSDVTKDQWRYYVGYSSITFNHKIIDN